MIRPPRSTFVLATVAVALTAVKLWLMRGQPLFAITGAGYDDRLFLMLAEHVRHGAWLGPYNQLTLAKGPFYPIWIAAVNLCHLPLHLAEEILYALACAALATALAPVAPHRLARLTIYLALLWNPMSYEARVLSRVLRQNLYTPLAMLIFAGLLGLILRPADPFRRRLPWALLLGFSFGGFWLTREEGIWIVPAVVLLVGFALATGRRAEALGPTAGLFGLAAGCAVLPVIIVCALNLHYYGWFGTVEFKAREFKDAYGALMRVTSPVDVPFVPVTAEARALIYPVSPAFVELRPSLEGAPGRQWAEGNSGLTGRPGRELEIAGGWFMWALRDAVASAGHATSARAALDYYRQLAAEVNAACEDGRLPHGPFRSGMVPRLGPGQVRVYAARLAEFGGYFISFSEFAADPPNSEGWDELFVLFHDLTLERMMPSPEAQSYRYARSWRGDHDKVAVLGFVGRSLGLVYYLAAIVALALGVFRLVHGLATWQLSITMMLAAAALGACAASVAVNALVDVTSFPNKSVGALAQAYPFLLLFIVLVAVEAATVLGAYFGPRRR